MISLHNLCYITITKSKVLELDGATTESTAIKEGKVGISDGANNMHWTDVEKCMEGMAPCEKANVDPSKTDMIASIHLLASDEACFELGCYAHMA